jgi:predicted glycosyltransferase
MKASTKKRKIWIDLENSPHVPFFLPIISELEKQGYLILLTARDCFQVCELADLAGLKYRKIGHHYGKNRVAKLLGLAIRVLQLAPRILIDRPDISVSHGSRSLIVLSGMLGIHSVNMTDYEHADHRLTSWLGSPKRKWMMIPEVVPVDIFVKDGILREHILQYPGIKEDVYVPSFRPDPALKATLGLQPSDIVVTLRPPATEAHYHNPESEKLLLAVLDLLDAHPEVRTVLLPRTHRQEQELRAARPKLFAERRIFVPPHAIDGLDLIWYSDLVISGGGTMNREAAALGVPVYSIFRGKLGAVDKYLSEAGKLIMLQGEEDVRERLRLVRRSESTSAVQGLPDTLGVVVKQICSILEHEVAV